MTLEEFTPLLQYPDEGYASRASRIAALAGSAPLRTFAEAVSRLTASEIQELFIRTFDLNPACTLEIGWHLFGEQYERGEFLVEVRGLLRRAGVAEIGELPDHLLHVLPLIARMSSADAAEFSRRFLAPALTKMAGALAKDNPFALSLAGLLEAVAAVHEPVGAGGAA